MRRLCKLVFLSSAAASLAVSANSPDLEAILKHAQDAYSNLKSCEVQAVVVNKTWGPDFEQTFRAKLVIAVEQPGKFRVEASGMGGSTTVCDGTNTWSYQSVMKKYTKSGLDQPFRKAIASGLSSALYVNTMGDSAKSAKLLREEDIPIDGSPHSCYLVELPNSGMPPMVHGSIKYWIDKTTYLVLKSESEQHFKNWPPTGADADMSQIATVESLKIDEPVPAALFTFTPPTDAKLVENFEFPGMKTTQASNLTGKPAPDFTLRDLSNNEVNLAGLRGKTVLLDFWATWCGPCRAEMPVIQKIHEENKDLVVLGINEGEDPDTVAQFVAEQRITFPILLARQEHMIDDYGAYSLPTVVIIDKDGNIRTHKIGYGLDTDEQSLRTQVGQAEKTKLVAQAEPVAPASTGGSYRIGGGVSAPTVLHKREPSYTEEARRANVSGTVVLGVVVSPEGKARNIRVVRSLGYGLDQKAVEAVESWEFRPGMKDGMPVAVQANIEVNFRLLNGPNTLPQPSATPPQTAEEAYRRGTELIRARHIDEGIGLLSRAIQMKPEWAQAWMARGRAQYQKRRYDEAIADFDEAIRLDPNNAGWYESRGLAYSFSDRHERAIEDYRKAIALNGNVGVYYANRGWAYTVLGQAEMAIADLDKAIQLTPDNLKAYENRAIAYMKLKDYPHAIANYTAALELGPTRWQYLHRAEAKRAMGDAAGAAADEGARGVARGATKFSRATKLAAAPWEPDDYDLPIRFD